MNELKLTSSAKVNLFLEVIGKRPDGYHQIETIFQEIDLHDDILLMDTEGQGIDVKVSPSLNIAKEENIAYKAAKLLQKKAKQFNKGAEILIEKRIPVGRGLGGGSSNAASVLKGLNELWELGFSTKDLADLGKELGMDVPFFICGGTCLGRERGEVITPLPDLSGIDILILWPDFPVSTAEVYRSISPSLTKKNRSAKLLTGYLNTRDFEGITKHLFNRLEDVALKIHPPLGHFKKQIASLTTGNIIMSGSGSAFFTILSSNWEEGSIKKEIRKLKGGYYIGETL